MDIAAGWDLGQTYGTSIYPTNQGQQTNQVIQQKFLDFLRNFRLENVYPYREQMRQNWIIKQFFLEVDMLHLISYDEELANQVKTKPGEYLPLFENALRSLAEQSKLMKVDDKSVECQVMIISRSNPVAIRDLDTTYISKLVRVPGTVLSVASIQSKATALQIMCRSCRHVKTLSVPLGFGGVQLPRVCDASSNDETRDKKCPVDPYQIVHDKSHFIDQQVLRLQETPGMVPVGELPRHLQMTCDRYLTNKVTAGMRITVTGIFTASRLESKKSDKVGTAAGLQRAYLRVIGLQIDPDGTGNDVRAFSPLEEEEFLQMARRPNLYEEFASSIAPSIYGNDDIKKAICCLLFGGSKKFLPDGVRLRGDVNVLLLGDPGTAKSQLLKFVQQVSPISVYTSGKGSSAAGLTASVIRDAASREFRLEAGAMVLGDGGVVCIDEFDKMNEDDRVAIHEAMEQQTISIAKAGITTILNSRTSVLAAANPVFGRYDDMKSPGENIDFQSTILSRFDLIFIVRDEHNEDRDRSIARHVLGVHRNVRPQEETERDLSIQKMRSFISYCKSKCAPRLTASAAEKLSSHFVGMREKARSLEGATAGHVKSAVPITIRQLEAIIRVSESLAKLSLSPVATEAHVDEAIRLFNHSTMDAIQSGMVEGHTRGQFSEEVTRVEDIIRRRFAVGSSMTERRLKDELIKQEFNPLSVEKAIFKLIRKEVLVYEDRRTKIRRVKA